MEHATSLSSSLPTPVDDACFGTLQEPFLRDSEPVLSQSPVTPPMSPSLSEEGPIPVRRHSTGADRGHPRPPLRILTPLSEWRDPIHLDPPRQHVRLLEDEESHVEQSGLLRLTDFEIKGTLGTFFFLLFLKNIQSINLSLF